jgi:hypothetical protein
MIVTEVVLKTLRMEESTIMNEDKTDVPDDMTREEYRESISLTPQPKVIAATVGAGVGFALGEIGTWVIETAFVIDIPANVEQAIGLVLTAGIAFLGGYFKKN